MLVSIYHLADTERTRARREPVSKPQMLIGSDAKCDIRIVDDLEVKPRHATIAVRALAGQLVAEVVLTPLTGTVLVNGKVVSNETTTKLGDTIQLGNTILKFRPDSAAAAQVSSPKIQLPPEDLKAPRPKRVSREPAEVPPAPQVAPLRPLPRAPVLTQAPTLVPIMPPIINANPPRPQPVNPRPEPGSPGT